MELNFDKEMDALLRQAAQQEKPVQPAAAAHLDADELAAFAGNALPVKARARAMEHLVDCGNCRTVLSNLVFFEDQPEEAPAAAPRAAVATASASLLDRIRAFFTMPVLAYGMGGLVLVFAGLLVFSVYRGNQDGMSLAQSNAAPAEKSMNDKSLSADGGGIPAAAPMANTNSSVNAANAAVAANTATSGAYSPYQPGSAANSAANTAADIGELALGKADKMPADKPKEKLEDDAISALKSVQSEAPAPVTRQEQTQNRQRENADEAQRGKDNYRSGNNILTPDGNDRRKASPPPASVAGAVARDAERGDDADKNASAAPAKKSFNGRQFRKDGAVWVDTAYRGQATVNVARESKEFKKLDDGLRKIAKEFSGAVIVVWKDTAYRIQ